MLSVGLTVVNKQGQSQWEKTGFVPVQHVLRLIQLYSFQFRHFFLKKFYFYYLDF